MGSKAASMTSSGRSDDRDAAAAAALPDLARDLPTTAADVAALRRLREGRPSDPFPDLSVFPATAEALARRPTAEGWLPFVL